MTKRKRTTFRILFILYLATVAWLCFGQFDNVSEVPSTLWGMPTDKVVHFLMFLPFPTLAFLSFGRVSRPPLHPLLCILIIFAAGALLAGITETVQSRLLPYRSGEVNDFYADLTALSAGCLLMLLIYPWKKRK